MDTRGSPRSLDPQNLSQASAASPSPCKDFELSSHQSMPQNAVARNAAPSFEAASYTKQRWLHQSEKDVELSSHTHESSIVDSPGLASPSSQSSALSPKQQSFVASHTLNCTPILQSKLKSQTDPWISHSPEDAIHETQVASSPTIAPRPMSPSVASNSSSGRASCSKVLKGEYLSGEHAMYDVDMARPGEAPQQLEVLPISVYGRDPAFVAGRQIAVNRRFICYCLRPGSIRILSRNGALKGLFQGHSQRVTDMAFFSESVHLLASASSDGRILAWKILEVAGTEGRMQISEQVLLSIQIIGDWKDAHPRVCWHPHLQECLVTCINNYVLRINLNEVRMNDGASDLTVDNSLKCHAANPMDGVQCLGTHESEVTDLSVALRDNICIASASKDGTVRIWGGKSLLPLSVLIPHEGQPVGSVAFISVPNEPDQTVLLTGGIYNHIFKLWIPANTQGFLAGKTWQSIQTLELKSSAEANMEQAFLNQVCVVQQAGLILLGNAKKHAMYSLHIDFGSSAATTRFDYLVEFSLTMPILSLTAMADNVVNSKGIAQVFCVQTQVIQQYFLNIALCIPPQEDEASVLKDSSVSNIFELSRSSTFGVACQSGEISSQEGNDKNNSSLPSEHNLAPDAGSGFGSWVEVPNWVAATLKKASRVGSILPSKEATSPVQDVGLTRSLSPLGPLRTLSPIPIDSSGEDRSLDVQPVSLSSSGSTMVNLDSLLQSAQNIDKPNLSEIEQTCTRSFELSSKLELTCMSNQSRLITPSDLVATVSSENAAFSADNMSKDCSSVEATFALHISNVQMDKDIILGKCCDEPGVCSGPEKESSSESLADVKDETLSVAASRVFESQDAAPKQRGGSCNPEGNKLPWLPQEIDVGTNSNLEALQEQGISDSLETTSASFSPATSNVYTHTKRKKNRIKAHLVETSTPTVSSSVPMEASFLFKDGSQNVLKNKEETTDVLGNGFQDLNNKVFALQNSLDHLAALQKELRKHVSLAVSVPMGREAKRVETFIEENLEMSFKSYSCILWNQMEEDSKKREEFQQECIRQLSTLIFNFTEKEVPSSLDQVFKGEIPSIAPLISSLATSNIESAITAAVNDGLQDLCEKSVTQLEKSLSMKLDINASWQLQKSFKTSGQQSLKDDFCSCFEELVTPKFRSSCENMLYHTDAALNQGMSDCAAYIQEQLASSCCTLVSNIKDAVASAVLTITSLKGELAEGQKRIFSVNENSDSNTTSVAWSRRQDSADQQTPVLTLLGSETSFEATVELSRLLRETQFEEAFTIALSLGSIPIVSWLCKQVDPKVVFAVVPPPLSQGVLLSLVHHLGCDLGKDALQKLIWIQEATLALNPYDPILAPHMRFILGQIYQNLQREMALFRTNIELANQARLVLHLVNSLLTTYK